MDSTDGTFRISSDRSPRVYHVDRNGARIGSFDMPFPIFGHEYAAGYPESREPGSSTNFFFEQSICAVDRQDLSK